MFTRHSTLQQSGVSYKYKAVTKNYRNRPCWE